MKEPSFAVVTHYPLSDAKTQRLYEEGNTSYPSACYEVGRYWTIKQAKAACRQKQQKLTGPAYAAIVDLRTSLQLEPNRYGRYEGYE